MLRVGYTAHFAARALGALSLSISASLFLACAGPADAPPILTADMPLHLEEHLDAATITGSETPVDVPEAVEWRFDEPQPDWRPAVPRREGMETVQPIQLDDALRLPFTPGMSNPGGFRAGGLYVDVPDWTLEDWGYVEIRARVLGLFANVGISFNYTEDDPSPAQSFYFYTGGNSTPVVSDGTVQTYRLSLDWGDMLASPTTVRKRWDGPWTHLAVWATAPDDQEEAALDILSIRVVPVEARYAGERERLSQPVEWRFDEPQPDWSVAVPQPFPPNIRPAEVNQTDEALQISLGHANANPGGRLVGGAFIEVPDWDVSDWAHVLIRARSTGPANLHLGFNLWEPGEETNDGFPNPFDMHGAASARLIGDGTVQTYELPMEPGFAWDNPIGRFGIWLNGITEPTVVEILSVSVVPVEALYSGGQPPSPQPVEWRFDEPQPDWRATGPVSGQREGVRPTRTEDGLRLTMTEENRLPRNQRLLAGIHIELPDWNLEDWAYVEVRARTRDVMRAVSLAFNYVEDDPALPGGVFYSLGDFAFLETDGTVQTYRLSLDDERMRPWEGPWTHLGLWFNSEADEASATVDILSVSVLPGEELYASGESGSLQPVEWFFDVPQPDWRPVSPFDSQWEAVSPVQIDDALRLPLDVGHRIPDAPRLLGGIYVEIPEWDLRDWDHVEIRARTSDPMLGIGLEFNYTENEEEAFLGRFPFISIGDPAPLVTDGTVQTYRLPLTGPMTPPLDGPWTELAIWFNSQDNQDAVTLDLISVRVVPKRQVYAAATAGVREVPVGKRIRRAVYTQAPSRIEYQIRVPPDGRLDVGLGVLREGVPVAFRVQAKSEAGEALQLLEESHADRDTWAQHQVDLSQFAGQTVELTLETNAERAGAISFWGAPTVSGSTRVAERPNVVFYVIDGAGAEYMSLYGYNRRTTPNIDRLAAEGAVFERAYSNSPWTRPSTASFMTSLQHSVLGGFKAGFNVVPEDVLTMAQHFHRARYQTGVFTPNPNAGKMSGLDREVDIFQESWEDFTYGQSGHWREGSRYLHEAFWTWREAYPGEPYWVHFQPVDIHGDFPAAPPFSGLFVSPEETNTWLGWRERRNRWQQENRRGGFFSALWEATGIDRVEFFTVAQGLYDEAMAFNDYQIGRLVERLKAEGEWANTLLVVAADHSIDAALMDMAIAIQDSLPPPWTRRTPMFRPSITRIPLLFVWPGHIPAGQRFREPVVSMVDVLPTILDLVGLQLPEVTQGQSLAPLLLGTGEAESRPVFFDQFEVDRETGELRGALEVIDGRWGASLEINPEPPDEDEPEEEAQWRRPFPLLLFDLWNDPNCFHSLHEERPDLVEKYRALLEEQWDAHLALGQLFKPSEALPLTPEQLEALRALGYIR